jgi:hypothetical protein
MQRRGARTRSTAAHSGEVLAGKFWPADAHAELR